MYKKSLEVIFDSVKAVAFSANEDDVQQLTESILASKKVFIYGSGRSGLVAQCFAVRLVQLGIDVHFIGDMTTPIISKGDVTVLVSNTGETMSAVQTANIARRLGSNVVCVTGSKNSKLAHASNICVTLDVKTSPSAPLGTLFEDAVMLLFDSIVFEIMNKKGISEDAMRKRHAIWV